MDQSIESKNSIVFDVDREHGALRLSIVVVFISLWIITFLLLNTLIGAEGLSVIAIVVSFVATALLTQQAEKHMKTRWPSGRTIHIDGDKIKLAKKSEVQLTIDADQRVNVLLWRFKINRRSRVPKGWFMVACALEQDENYIPVYAFLSPNDYEDLSKSGQFKLLQSKKELEKQGSDIRLAGEQRRLHTAESIRWMNGAEMSPEDLKTFLTHLQERFPQWMPSVV